VGRILEHRAPVAVVATAGGRGLPVLLLPARFEVSPVAVLRAFGLEVLSLIGGSRREPGGRRGGRS